MTGHHHDVDADVSIAVLTVSSSRSLEDDPAGDAVAAAFADDDATVARRELVTDDREAVAAAVRSFVDDGLEAVVTSGGTGLTPDDVTVEAVEPLFDKSIPGFGEFFRRRSVDHIGTAAMASRATAGVIDGTVVFCLPGSEDAAALGAAELIRPELAHFVHLARREDA